jgi:hypothetical protein
MKRIFATLAAAVLCLTAATVQASATTPTRAVASASTTRAPATTLAACQGQVGCDSGWIAHNCYDADYRYNVNIRVIWRGTGLREVYFSGSYYPQSSGNGADIVRIWASIPPDGTWTLKGDYEPGPRQGDWQEVTYSVLSPNLPHNWQARMDFFGYWCNTPQVLN